MASENLTANQEAGMEIIRNLVSALDQMTYAVKLGVGYNHASLKAAQISILIARESIRELREKTEGREKADG